MKAKIGQLVRCQETSRVGVVVEVKRAAWAMMALVKWPRDGVKWVDVAELSEVK